MALPGAQHRHAAEDEGIGGYLHLGQQLPALFLGSKLRQFHPGGDGKDPAGRHPQALYEQILGDLPGGDDGRRGLVEPPGAPVVLDPGGQMPGPHQQGPVSAGCARPGSPTRNPGSCGCSGCPPPPRPGAGAARPRPPGCGPRRRPGASPENSGAGPAGTTLPGDHRQRPSRWPRCRMARASTRMRRSCPPQPREASVCRMDKDF